MRIIYENGGIYLDTDVLLHNGLDELLQYSCWLASDDVRFIATGLGFGAEKGNALIKAMMEAYSEYEYPSGTNVDHDTKILERELTAWKKSDRTQIIDDILLIGLLDYGKYARHLYTYSWADEAVRKQRETDILAGGSNRFRKIIWKIKCAVRNPRLIAFFDNRKGSLFEKIYTFLAYDFLDNGVMYYLRRLYKKLSIHKVDEWLD